MTDCVHCWGDGTPVYPHDEHETRDHYIARQEAALIREALEEARQRDLMAQRLWIDAKGATRG